MAKKKRTKELGYAILYLSEVKGMKVEEICLELGAEQALVEGVLAEVPKTKADAPSKKPSKTQNLMIRHTAGKNTNNVAIMTEAASMMVDHAIKTGQTTGKSPHDNAIFRPNG